MSTLSADGVKLRVVPSISSQPHPDAIDLSAFEVCTGDYTCECMSCETVRQHRVKMGVRGSRGIPFKQSTRLAA